MPRGVIMRHNVYVMAVFCETEFGYSVCLAETTSPVGARRKLLRGKWSALMDRYFLEHRGKGKMRVAYIDFFSSYIGKQNITYWESVLRGAGVQVFTRNKRVSNMDPPPGFSVDDILAVSKTIVEMQTTPIGEMATRNTRMKMGLSTLLHDVPQKEELRRV